MELFWKSLPLWVQISANFQPGVAGAGFVVE